MSRSMTGFKFSVDVMFSFTLYTCLVLYRKILMSFESGKNELFCLICLTHLFLFKSRLSKTNRSAAHLPCLSPQETFQQSFPSI